MREPRPFVRICDALGQGVEEAVEGARGVDVQRLNTLARA